MNATFAHIKFAVSTGRFFSVRFLKADGTVRTMVCRAGVTKGVKGTETPEERADRKLRDEVQGIIRVWTKDGFRSFRVDSIISMRVDGRSYDFEPVIHEAAVEYDLNAKTALVRLADSVWTCKVQKNGKVAIPADARRALGGKAEDVERRLLG